MTICSLVCQRSISTGERRRNMDAEIAERVRREAQEKNEGQKVPSGDDATP